MFSLALFVLKDRFTLDKPGHAECDDGDRLEPKSWSKPLNQGFDRWQRDDSNEDDTSQDGISADAIDGVSLQLSTVGFLSGAVFVNRAREK